MLSRTRPFRLLGPMGVLGALLLAAGSPVAAAQPPPRPAAGPGANHATDDPFTSSRTSWWRQDRFGMFIHFGAYSNLEGEYTRPDGTVCRNAEWIKRECEIPDDVYEKQAATFNPSAFDAGAIVRAAKDAGQRYIVITAKHHDGYAMWPTRQNTWNLRDHSAFDPHRDILAELKKAADAAGIKLGFYYSIWDWHDPDFAGPATFPRYKKRMYGQLKELIDSYDPALLWFDGEWDADNPTNRWSRQDGADLQAYLHGLNPHLIVNNRVGKREVVDGDFGTPEQEIPAEPVDGQLWESCMTLNDHWGYARYDTHWKPAATVVRNLLEVASRGGNYLLNVGPDKTGRIPQPSVDRLRETGRWLGAYGQGDAVHGAGYTGLVADPSWGTVSRRGGTLYAAVTSWPAAGAPLHLTAKGRFEITAARVLGSSQQVKVARAGDGFDLTPSGTATGPLATVIRLTITPPADAPAGTGTGLTARSWANGSFTGPPAVTTVDPTVNKAYRFDGSPDPAIPADHFSTRWTGSIQPRFDETYTFTAVSDDTVRLWIDGKLVIDNTTPHGPKADKGTVTLRAGHRHSIRLDHTEQTGEAYMKLLWSSPSQPQQIVPQRQLYAD
ncbi:alpha-L-fucosidase [Streptomyces sp. 2224.1]|uniref:alpha-L-fucosidase n=1 Tax=unclassified Streptomyces TaxID=2593676 RepID=UPI00088877F3|nr:MULTISPECIES: alpha-L-fucosidase [unclassified Streptomyces]PBC86311.1 alpha-L-fucosidase [Streptomyces sp. 2321.6]SDQ89073.1 alpha-L-fucosidase [Streptomyces sp. KS_16]SED71885.1 alpha-L-fucosidase [Streptomyces sp. 2112.3]SED94476.1 alpha-L-fucosidase [Streptomyces sp. 2133.1]SED94886.1 alpha-L-fucosidase [Streptomyces sp. 2224.1]